MLTKPVQKQKKSKKKKRKTAKRKKFKIKQIKFKDTKLGRFFYVYDPVTFYLINDYIRLTKAYYEKDYSLMFQAINRLSNGECGGVEHTKRFRNAADEFVASGLYPTKKADWCLTDAVYYALNSYKIHRSLKRGALS